MYALWNALPKVDAWPAAIAAGESLRQGFICKHETRRPEVNSLAWGACTSIQTGTCYCQAARGFKMQSSTCTLSRFVTRQFSCYRRVARSWRIYQGSRHCDLCVLDLEEAFDPASADSKDGCARGWWQEGRAVQVGIRLCSASKFATSSWAACGGGTQLNHALSNVVLQGECQEEGC